MKRRRKFVLATLVVVAGFLLWFREPPEIELPAPLVERLESIGDRDLDYRTVADIMTKPAICVQADARVLNADTLNGYANPMLSSAGHRCEHVRLPAVVLGGS